MITSTANGKIKNVNKCLKSARERKKQDIFLVEGLRMFVEIPQQMNMETYATEEFYHAHGELFKGISFELVSEHVMDTISDTRTPQGVVSMVKRKHYEPEEVCGAVSSGAPLILAIENLQDPGNLGTIVRTAEGAGVTGILMSSDTVDIYNPKVVRATMGSIFRVPFCYVANLAEWILELGRREYRTYSAHMQGTRFYDMDYRYPTIFCIGNEGNGLSEALIRASDCKISIPMAGKVESLNAATAATVLMYEAMRQRNTLNRQK